MKRGDIIVVSTRGDHGKPRPAVVIQSDFIDDTDSVLVVLMTTTVRDTSVYRMLVAPDDTNGLRQLTQVMTDKIYSVIKTKCGGIIGCINKNQLAELNAKLTLVLGLAD